METEKLMNSLDENPSDSRSRLRVSTKECAAMRILARDDYTAGVLKMTMHLSSTSAVYRHVRGDCAHTHKVPAVETWDGEQSPAKLSNEDRV